MNVFCINILACYIKSMRKSTTGFTIVELLIVIVVIAILATISIVAYTGIQARANDSKRINDVAAIRKALALHKADNGAFPLHQPNPGAIGWEISTDPGFLNSLSTYTNGNNFPSLSGSEYRYRRFAAGASGCPIALGEYYIIWVIGMQAQTGGAMKLETNGCTAQTAFSSAHQTANPTQYAYWGF